MLVLRAKSDCHNTCLYSCQDRLATHQRHFDSHKHPTQRHCKTPVKSCNIGMIQTNLRRRSVNNSVACHKTTRQRQDTIFHHSNSQTCLLPYCFDHSYLLKRCYKYSQFKRFCISAVKIYRIGTIFPRT